MTGKHLSTPLRLQSIRHVWSPEAGAPPYESACWFAEVREPLGEGGYQKLQAGIRTLGYVTELLENREATLATLRRLLCRGSTEKTAQVLKQAGVEVGEKRRKPAGPGVVTDNSIPSH